VKFVNCYQFHYTPKVITFSGYKCNENFLLIRSNTSEAGEDSEDGEEDEDGDDEDEEDLDAATELMYR
jgi:hypothetical protein